MMIKINLLPVRQSQKREVGRQWLVGIVGALILALAGNFVWWRWMDGRRETIQARVDSTKSRIAELEKIIGEVNNLKKRLAEVKEKTGVVNDLRARKKGPVRMMDALASSIPKKVWVDDFGELEGKVSLKGQAESYEDVSEFMKGLSSVVWTPKGLGRVIEKKREAVTARVELLTGDSVVEDFAVSDLKNFFNSVELKSTEVGAQAKNAPIKFVKFDIQMTANYSI